MRIQKQKNLHNPEAGIFGDCYRTALAVLLDMDAEEVPHWVTTMNPQEWTEAVQPKYDAWLAERGLRELAIPLQGETDLEAVLLTAKNWWRDTPIMLTGRSSTLCNHVVIVQGGEIACDPSITDSGIIGPCDDGYWWITGLVPIDPPAKLKQLRREAP